MITRKKSFTLVELIMVIAIIGILAAVAVPRFANLRAEASRAQCESSIGAIMVALANYYVYYSMHSATYMGRFPPSIHDIDGYFREGTVPPEPAWNLVSSSVSDWDDAYTSGAVGSINGDKACRIDNFQ